MYTELKSLTEISYFKESTVYEMQRCSRKYTDICISLYHRQVLRGAKSLLLHCSRQPFFKGMSVNSFL